MSVLRVGISPCPNDTYAFHALLTGEVASEAGPLAFALLDVEELNRRMLAGELDVAKVSAHAALALAERVLVLESGAALGFGVGPLLLASPAARRGRATPPRVLVPGEWTTAHLLWRLFHPEPARVRHVVFSAILPALAAGEAELGVCIHEGRFTWRAHGLELVEDLGERYERATGAALPLGLIVCRRELGARRAAALARSLGASIARADAAPEAALATMARHAQELAPEVLWKHVELYVNERTRALGPGGRAALAALADLARARGLVDGGGALEVVGFEAPPGPEDAEPAGARLFHLAAGEDWRRAADAPRWSPPSLGREGFVHLSFGEDLAGTLAAHFAGAAEPLVLVEVDGARLGPALRLEPSRGGKLFPHLGRPLERAELLGAWTLRRGPRGWTLPRLGRAPAEDAPAAGPPYSP